MSDYSVGYIDDVLGERTCVWFPIGQVDREAVLRELDTEDVAQGDYAIHIHPRVKWCEKYSGWPCDQEGEWHEHWEFTNGAPTHTAVWDANASGLFPTETKETQ